MKSIIIFSFMIKDLKLKGVELLVYAFIYSFTQFGFSVFMKPEKIAESLGVSRAQVFRALSSLLSKGYIFFVHDGYTTNNSDKYNSQIKDNLDELIRIAKTPWLGKLSQNEIK